METAPLATPPYRNRNARPTRRLVPKLAQARAAEAFQVVLPVGFQFDRHLASNPGKRNIGLRAAKFLQGSAGDISFAGHPGRRRQHPMTSHKIVTLPDALTRQPYRLIILAADKVGISRDAAKNRREWIARRQLQRALCCRTTFLPAPAIRQGQAVIALG